MFLLSCLCYYAFALMYIHNLALYHCLFSLFNIDLCICVFMHMHVHNVVEKFAHIDIMYRHTWNEKKINSST